MAESDLGIVALEAQADRDDGVFGDHLRRMLGSLMSAGPQDSHMSDAVRTVLKGGGGLAMESFYRLRSAGILTGNSPNDAELRCGLYRMYLAGRLL